jgi:hypothetical protein
MSPGLSPLGCDASDTSNIEVDSRKPTDDPFGLDCCYIDYLHSKGLKIDKDKDCVLLEHLTSGHLEPCSPFSASNAEEIVHTVPIREEIPFDQVHCLKLVNLRDELLSPRHIRLLKLIPPVSTDLPDAPVGVRAEVFQASLDGLTKNCRPLFAAASYVCGDQTLTRSVLCGQNYINIPHNAYDVIVHLRFKDRPRPAAGVGYLVEAQLQIGLLVLSGTHAAEGDVAGRGDSSGVEILRELWHERRVAEWRLWNAVEGVLDVR